MRQKLYSDKDDEILSYSGGISFRLEDKKSGKSVKLTTSVMLRIFLVMVSLSWFGVGVNHNFWNVSFTSFYKEHKVH